MNTSYLAERVGFEPTVMLPPRLISSQVHSTTLPPLLCVEATDYSQIQQPLEQTGRQVSRFGCSALPWRMHAPRSAPDAWFR